MTDEKVLKPYGYVEDYLTGRRIPLIGAEENRQKVERYIVEQKGYAKEEIEVDRPLEITVGKDRYRSQIDLLVRAGEKPLMAVKCVAGSLDSRQREIVAACRIAESHPIPLGVVSDGRSARIIDAISGVLIGERLADIPTRSEAAPFLEKAAGRSLDADRIEKEKRIFRTYDMEDVNVQRKLAKSD